MAQIVIHRRVITAAGCSFGRLCADPNGGFLAMISGRRMSLQGWEHLHAYKPATGHSIKNFSGCGTHRPDPGTLASATSMGRATENAARHHVRIRHLRA